MKLKRSYAMITGAGKGIGRAVAAALMERGARVFGISRTKADLESLKSQYEEKFDYAVGDVTDGGFLKSVEGKFEGVEILVNNAGFGILRPVEEMTVEEFKSVIETNLNAVFAVSKLAIPSMIRRNGGVIINISSLAGRNAFAGGTAYCASKSGLNSLTECMMLDLRKHNIKVMNISPGTVVTGFSHKSHWSEEKRAAYPTADDIAQIVIDALELPDRCLVSKFEVRPTNPR